MQEKLRERTTVLKQRTLQLFQLLLIVFAFYLPLKHGGDQSLLASLACLCTVLVMGKVETSVTEYSKRQSKQRHDTRKKDEAKKPSQALDWLLKSKNVQLIIDGIQVLLQDLGLAVSPCTDYPGIDRLVRIPDMQVTWGLKILSDVAVLNENWDQWEELAAFDEGKEGKQRVLIIGSNCIEAEGDGQQKYRSFPASAQKLLSSRQVMAMTTLTLGKIYVSCKKKKADIKTIFQPIEHHPGGVLKL